MPLTITTTHQPATDLGYLLVKRPDRVHSRTVSFGEAHVFYLEASDERCTAALGCADCESQQASPHGAGSSAPAR